MTKKVAVKISRMEMSFVAAGSIDSAASVAKNSFLRRAAPLASEEASQVEDMVTIYLLVMEDLWRRVRGGEE